MADHVLPVDPTYFRRVLYNKLHLDDVRSYGLRFLDGCKCPSLSQPPKRLYDAIRARYSLIDICCRSLPWRRNELYLDYHRRCYRLEKLYSNYMWHLLGNCHSNVLCS